MSSYLINDYIIIPSLFLFLYIYIIRFILVISRNDWFIVWLGLEINIMAFIVLIYCRDNVYNIESCMKYFFIQRLRSALFVSIFYLNKEFISYGLTIILGLKIGLGPFFFWFPSVCSGLRWISCFVLITIQKIMPLILILIFGSILIWIIIFIRLILGAFGSFNQINVKQLIAYSSVHHLGWILVCGIIGGDVWILYLLLYFVIIIGVIVMFLNKNVVDLRIINKWKGKWWFVIGMLRMAGIPPLLGFFLKWIAFSYILIIDIMFVVFIIFISVIIFYVYLRFLYDILISYRNFNGWINYTIYNYQLYIDMYNVFGFLLGVLCIWVFLF